MFFGDKRLDDFKRKQLADQIYMTYGHPIAPIHHQHQAQSKAKQILHKKKSLDPAGKSQFASFRNR